MSMKGCCKLAPFVSRLEGHVVAEFLSFGKSKDSGEVAFLFRGPLNLNEALLRRRHDRFPKWDVAVSSESK